MIAAAFGATGSISVSVLRGGTGAALLEPAIESKTSTRGLNGRRGSGSSRSPETPFDLRTAFLVERRLLPALLLIGLVAAAAATAAGSPPLVWGWFALYAVNSAARYLLATTYGDARRAIDVDARCARQYLACAIVDIGLWATLLALVPQPVAFVAGPGAFAACGAVLLAALSFGGWPRVWTFYVATWVAVAAIVAFRTSGSLTSFALAFPLWLLAVWWLGRQQPLSRLAAKRAPPTLISNPTKFGWQAAIHAIPTPVIVARNGRIIEVNRSACEFVGRSERSILGSPIEECLIAEPPEALQPEHHRSESSAAVEIRPANRTFEGIPWSGRVRYMEPGRSTSVVVVALTQAAQQPFGSARLIEDARRFAEWIGGLQGLPWYRDERGLLVVPQEFPPPDVALPADADAFPLGYLLTPSERERINSVYREVMNSGGMFDERMALRDTQGGAREVRVVCMVRPNGGDSLAPLIGTIAAARPLPVRAPADPGTDLLSRLPVVVWLVDSGGRVLHATGSEPRRWGMVAEARTRPDWQHAFAFKPESVPAVQQALQKALAGQPSFDVRNFRTSPSGGILNLRSHFVPYAGRQLQAVLVMDTIASPVELLEIDRLKRSKAQYKSLVEASASLIWACDADFTLTFASRRAARNIYGYETRELLGKPVDVLLPTDAEQPALRRAFEGLRDGHGDPRSRGSAHQAGWPPRHRVDQCGAAAASGWPFRRRGRHERRPDRAEVARDATVGSAARRAHGAGFGRPGHCGRQAGAGAALQRRVPAVSPACRPSSWDGRRCPIACWTATTGTNSPQRRTKRAFVTRRWCANCACSVVRASAMAKARPGAR